MTALGVIDCGGSTRWEKSVCECCGRRALIRLWTASSTTVETARVPLPDLCRECCSIVAEVCKTKLPRYRWQGIPVIRATEDRRGSYSRGTNRVSERDEPGCPKACIRRFAAVLRVSAKPTPVSAENRQLSLF